MDTGAGALSTPEIFVDTTPVPTVPLAPLSPLSTKKLPAGSFFIPIT